MELGGAFVFAAWAVGAYYTLAFVATLLKTITDLITHFALQRKIKNLVIGFDMPKEEKTVGFDVKGMN